MPQWLVLLAGIVSGLWVWSGLVLQVARDWFHADTARTSFDGLRWVVSELRPLYLPAVLVMIADESLRGKLFGWDLFWSAMSILAYFIYKNEGDDRWKRRRKKAAEKVKALASGRLVVVPSGAPS